MVTTCTENANCCFFLKRLLMCFQKSWSHLNNKKLTFHSVETPDISIVLLTIAARCDRQTMLLVVVTYCHGNSVVGLETVYAILSTKIRSFKSASALQKAKEAQHTQHDLS